MIKTAKHPTGIEIFFHPETHRYNDSLSRSYESVTSIVKALYPPFDADAISTRKAAREGVDAAALRAEWDAKGKEACITGTRTHEIAEDSLLNRKPRHAPRTPRERAAFRCAWEAGQLIRSKSASVHPEQIIFCPETLTAGTADLLAVKRDGSGLICVDWKTNAHIDETNKYGGKALAPYEHIPDCSLFRYGLQLHLYANIIKKWYIRADEALTITLAHIAPDATEVSWLSLPDLSREADAIMKARRADVGRIRALSNRIRETFAADAALDAQIPPELQDNAI